MKAIESDKFIVEMNKEDIENLMMFCNTAGLSYRQRSFNRIAEIAEDYWSQLYTIKNREDKPF